MHELSTDRRVQHVEHQPYHRLRGSGLLAGFVTWTTTAQSQALAMAPEATGRSIGADFTPNDGAAADSIVTDSIPDRLQRQVVNYPNHEAPGTIIVDTPHTYLYFVVNGERALRYGIGVGRKGFTWSGVKAIVRKTEWPDWYPPQEMIARQPYLPRMMAGGPGNPLGARALYIGGTEFRIHGTNNPSSIGKHMSSGCIRLTNNNIIDLFSRVKIGAKVIVLPMSSTHVSSRIKRNPSVQAANKTTVANVGRPHSLY
jgi:lipoprotein-anchoring transpeptidase ErfK/SrfK